MLWATFPSQNVYVYLQPPFTQCAPKATGSYFGEITQNKGHYAVQGRRFWYQSKAHIRLPISD